jgi:hypothetical protein
VLRARAVAEAMSSEAPKVRVIVPPASFRVSAMDAVFWDMLGELFTTMKKRVGTESALTLIGSRFSRELRRELGVEGAQEVLRQYAEGQPAIAPMDIDDQAERR